jgi:hypothetical protein
MISNCEAEKGAKQQIEAEIKIQNVLPQISRRGWKARRIAKPFTFDTEEFSHIFLCLRLVSEK